MTPMRHAVSLFAIVPVVVFVACGNTSEPTIEPAGVVPHGDAGATSNVDASALAPAPDADADANANDARPDGPVPDEPCGNGLDDDGDGKIDEACKCAAAATQPCYVGVAAQAGVGACKWGTQTCDAAGMFGAACTGSGSPSTEQCGNNVDDDCNGTVDEGCDCAPAATRSCFGGEADREGVGICKAGTQTCSAAGKWGDCKGQVLPTVGDACNAKDDDCDGQVDQTCECIVGESRSCYEGPAGTAGVGLCKGGLQTCSAQGTWGGCVGQVVPTNAEVCGNGKDDDCSGKADDGCPCSAGEVTLSTSVPWGSHWTFAARPVGADYGVLWSQPYSANATGALTFAKVSETGAVQTAPTVIATSSTNIIEAPWLSFNGTDFSFSYYTLAAAGDTQFGRVTTVGARSLANVAIPGGDSQTVTSNGAGLNLIVNNTFRIYDDAGTFKGGSTYVGGPWGGRNTNALWNGAQFVATYATDKSYVPANGLRYDVYLSFVGTGGAVTGTTPITADKSGAISNTSPDIASSGSQYAVLYLHVDHVASSRSWRVQRVTSAGVLEGGAITLPNSNAGAVGSIVWTGTKYVTARECSQANAPGICIDEIDTSGAISGSRFVPTCGIYAQPVIAWNGSKLALFYKASDRGLFMLPSP